MSRIKRHRGGQPGNQNARKHGFYSPYLSREESRSLGKALDKGADNRKAAALGVKLKSALSYNPENRRVIREACRLLYKMVESKYSLSKQEKREFRKMTRLSFYTTRDKIARTIEAKKAKISKKSPEPSEAKIENQPKNSQNKPS